MSGAKHVSLTDARRAGFCVLGIRAWLKARDVDFRDFKANGIDGSAEPFASDAHIQRILSMRHR